MVDTVRFMGSYSGIDMSMVEQMMEAERARGNRFTQQKENYQREQNAWKDLNTRLDNLYNRLEGLSNVDTFQGKTVSSTGEGNVSVSASNEAATGDYYVQVDQLATQSRLFGSRVDIDSIHDDLELAEGSTLEINAGGETFTIEIDPDDSLRDIQDKINGLTQGTRASGDNPAVPGSGIRANIVDNRLVLNSTEYGEQEFSIGGSAAADLGLADSEVELGQNAVFRVDGMVVERSSNQIDDVIEGLTFNLTTTHADNQGETITIAEDHDALAEELEKLVEQYNSVQRYIETQTDVGDPSAEDNETGALVGDSAIIRLQRELRNLFSFVQDTPSESIRNLGDLGIEIDQNGVASFNRTEFDEAINEDPDDVRKFFTETTRVRETTINDEGEEVSRVRDEHSGFAHNARSLINTYVSSTSGLIKTRTETYDRMIQDVNRRIETFNERLDRRQERMIRQFAALDTAMMQAESQMDQLFSQLAGLG